MDPSGGAGLSLDTRVMQDHGGFPMTVAACLTVQNCRGVRSVHPVDRGLVVEMIAAAVEDGPVDAVKVGMLASPDLVVAVADALAFARAAAVPVVVDPVLGTTAGGWDAGAELVVTYRRVLLPNATVVTPNLPELELLSAGEPGALLDLGCRAVLVTGGHAAGDVVEDRLHRAGEELVFRHPRLSVGSVHGTGCALASALASRLASGASVDGAARDAVATVQRYLANTDPGDAGATVPIRV